MHWASLIIALGLGVAFFLNAIMVWAQLLPLSKQQAEDRFSRKKRFVAMILIQLAAHGLVIAALFLLEPSHHPTPGEIISWLGILWVLLAVFATLRIDQAPWLLGVLLVPAMTKMSLAEFQVVMASIAFVATRFQRRISMDGSGW